jgi:hypothetical protein
VGILAAIVLMFGGVLWLTAGGNPNRIENAKAWIGGSLTGLILALLSYLILYTLNPSLVNFQTMQPGTVEDSKLDISDYTCQWKDTGEDYLCNKALGSGWVNMDGTHCPGEEQNKECCCIEKSSQDQDENTPGETGTHKGCCYLVDFSGNRTYKCGTIAGDGADECSDDGECTSQNSNVECMQE